MTSTRAGLTTTTPNVEVTMATDNLTAPTLATTPVVSDQAATDLIERALRMLLQTMTPDEVRALRDRIVPQAVIR